MKYRSFSEFIELGGQSGIATGPICVIFAEDPTEIDSTIAYHVEQGFVAVLVFGDNIGLTAELPENVLIFQDPIKSRNDAVELLNRVIPLFEDRWIYWCFNAEYLFFPFCESRCVADLISFMVEERRSAVFGYAIDIFAKDLYRAANAVDRDDAHLDKSGYYGFQRYRDGQPLDRQFDIYGGLGWRFEEYVPFERRRIDRISLFQARKGLVMNPDLTLSDDEMNTICCPWHSNVTIALVSFRVAKSLKRNPGSTFEINNFCWRQSVKFEWSSQQLMKLGFIDPGQWF